MLLRRNDLILQDFLGLRWRDTRRFLFDSLRSVSSVSVAAVSGNTPALLGARKSAYPKLMELPDTLEPETGSLAVVLVPVGSVSSKLPGVGSSAFRSNCR